MISKRDPTIIGIRQQDRCDQTIPRGNRGRAGSTKAAVRHWKLSVHFPSEFDLTNQDLTDQIVRLLGRGEKIEAVKLYQEATRSGLKGAKEAVERIGEQNGIRSIQDLDVSASCSWGSL